MPGSLAGLPGPQIENEQGQAHLRHSARAGPGGWAGAAAQRKNAARAARAASLCRSRFGAAGEPGVVSEVGRVQGS